MVRFPRTDASGHLYTYTEGGLASCEICHGAEGSLPTQCPNAPMSHWESQRVYAGQIDFQDGAWRLLARRGLVIRIDGVRILRGVPIEAVDPWPLSRKRAS